MEEEILDKIYVEYALRDYMVCFTNKRLIFSYMEPKDTGRIPIFKFQMGSSFAHEVAHDQKRIADKSREIEALKNNPEAVLTDHKKNFAINYDDIMDIKYGWFGFKIKLYRTSSYKKKKLKCSWNLKEDRKKASETLMRYLPTKIN